MSPFMIIGESDKKDFCKAKKRVDISVAESVKVIREFQEIRQNELADITGIPQSIISAIENTRVQRGVERARTLAGALN